MIVNNNEELISKIGELFREQFDKKEFGSFSVTVTFNHGRTVRLETADRENLVRYGSQKIVVEK